MKALEIKVPNFVFFDNIRNLPYNIKPKCLWLYTWSFRAIKIEILLCVRCNVTFRIFYTDGVHICFALKSFIHAENDILMISII